MTPAKPQPPAALLERDDTIRIALVRHGETFQNRGHVVQGQDPTYGRLTEAGMHQARLLGEALAARPLDAVYASPLERAVMTMAFVLAPRPGDRTLPLHFPDDLREIHLGMLQGRPHSEWRAAMDGHDPMTFRSPGGESWLDVQNRVTHWFQEVILEAVHRNVLIVAHGGVNRGLISSLTGMTMGEAWQGPGIGTPQDNTCLNDLLMDRDGRLLWALVNDSGHLIEHFDGASHGQLWHPEGKRWKLVGERPFADRGAGFDPYG
ncbi:MAG TPA: histidine phosphatase family protein [bacterium]|nr:histidine phosphatase family protein [bacterium]